MTPLSMVSNSHSSVVLTCAKCGMKYQAITYLVRKCICGGDLVPARVVEKLK
jgi:hypothetical protein